LATHIVAGEGQHGSTMSAAAVLLLLLQYMDPETTGAQKQYLAWHMIRESSVHNAKEEEVRVACDLRGSGGSSNSSSRTHNHVQTLACNMFSCKQCKMPQADSNTHAVVRHVSLTEGSTTQMQHCCCKLQTMIELALVLYS
jgi:hypothetical protein